MMTKLEILRRLIEKGTEAFPWCGNLAMQKLVYLLEAGFDLDLGYPFGLHHLGPYSPELAQAISFGEQAGFWKSRDEQFMSPAGLRSGKRFSVESPFLEPEVRREADQMWRGMENSVDVAIGELKSLSGKQLELIATLHYLRHVQETRENELSGVLRTLKPKYSEAEVDWGREKLRNLDGKSALAA